MPGQLSEWSPMLPISLLSCRCLSWIYSFFLLFIRMFFLSHVLFGKLFWLSDNKQKNCKVSFKSLHSVFAICMLFVDVVWSLSLNVTYYVWCICRLHGMMFELFILAYVVCQLGMFQLMAYSLCLSLCVRACLNIINYTRNLMFCCFKSIVVMP